MSEKVFAIVFPYQKDEIEEWCWGDGCGKGAVGAIDIGPSMAIACSEAECPFEEKVSDCIGELDQTGKRLHVRRLRSLESMETSS